MDDSGPTASIILFVFVIMIDVLFYGFGSAIQTMNKNDVEKRLDDEKDIKSNRILHIMEKPEKYVNTVQFVSTFLYIIIGAYSYVKWNNKIWYPAVIAIIVTFVALIFGVLIPKKMASKHAEKWVYQFINPIYYSMVVLTPFTISIQIICKAILRIFGIHMEEDNADVTEEEIISMVNEGHEQGVLLASEAEMITNIFEFGDKEAQDIMTHRINIVAIDGMMSFKEAIHFMLQEKNSRYPVYIDNIDHIIGIINIKDALRIHAADEEMDCTVKDVKGLIREAHFIPETRNIDALFKTMQSMKIQMVIVVDEYGQTAGLVAMEDILEEIVGNIMDEYDEDEAYIEEKGNNEYIIEGMTPLEELEEKFGIHFKEEEFDTLNGFLISKMDKIPDDDEKFEITVDGYRFKVLSVENKMIHTVLVTKLKEDCIE